ncbi:MAG: hypothetical protein AB1730_00910 [Myxococcota bacterium]
MITPRRLVRLALALALVAGGNAMAQQQQCDGRQFEPSGPARYESDVVQDPAARSDAESGIMPPWLGFFPTSGNKGQVAKLEFEPFGLFYSPLVVEPGSQLWSQVTPSLLYHDSSGMVATAELWGGSSSQLVSAGSTWRLVPDFDGSSRFARYERNILRACEADCTSQPSEIEIALPDDIHWVRLRWPNALVIGRNANTYSAYLVDIPSQSLTLLESCSGPATGDFDGQRVYLGCSGTLVVVDRATLKVDPLFDDPCAFMEFGFPQLTDGWLVFQENYLTTTKTEIVALKLSDVGLDPNGDPTFRVGKSDHALYSTSRPAFTAGYFGTDLGSKRVVTWWVWQDPALGTGYGVTFW